MEIIKARKHITTEVADGETYLCFVPADPKATTSAATAAFITGIAGVILGWYPASVFAQPARYSYDGFNHPMFWFVWIGAALVPFAISFFIVNGNLKKPRNKWSTVVLDDQSVRSAGQNPIRYAREDLGDIYSKENPVSFTYKASNYDEKRKAAEAKTAKNYSVIADLGNEEVEIVPPSLTKPQAIEIRDAIAEWKNST